MPTRVPLLSHPAETELFGDALTCEAWLPAGFRAGEARQPPAAAESLLHALAIAEDARGDDTDDRKGEPSISTFDDYTSHNTKRLGVEELEALLKTLPIVSESLDA